PRRGRGRAHGNADRPLRGAPAPLLRPRAVRRDHAPEADDGGGRRPLRRDDGRRRHLADRLPPRSARRGRRARRRVAFPAVARSCWELLGEDDAQPEPEEQRAGLFARLRDSLGKSRRALTGELAAAAFDPGNELDWERLEEALIRGDVGVRATAELVRRLELRGDLGNLNEALADEIAALFGEPPVLDLGERPAVVLVVGVNGTGKTTTIGKLASKLRGRGRSVVVAAADTFRAA